MDPRFWRVLEASQLAGFSYRYLVLQDEQGEPLAFLGLYSVLTDIAIFAPPFLKRVLAPIRRRWPGFLKWTMLECGTPITIVSPPIAQVAGLPRQQLVDRLASEMRRLARAEGHLLLVVRDFEPAAEEEYREDFARHGFHWIEGLPNTYLDLPWRSPAEYHQAMRSYYRSKLKKHRRANEALGVRHELRRDFADLAEVLSAQWQIVHDAAKEFQREILTPQFYRSFSEGMGDDSLVLLFYCGDELVAHALLLRDGTLMRWLYVGRNAAQNDGLYLHVAATVVDTAIELGAERLELGLTTYDVKLDLGATAVPIAMALRARWAWMNPFVGWGYRALNQVPRPAARQVFKEGESKQ
ncbi:GNAT family N-acetyltransferase [Acidithiobacillus sp. CV18-2]|uniref:GNAT family N-acetyltransferase n=1 Tax=Igneacidithiobacillus copahuensis TaxID=2724909 RepID=A0AAE3CKL6_9PROT|nr:GNAT family N-acetyltransferase [Igneacidithiobacillus copahuensis]MBU2753365.1 GNAT family N-acetyltransferase [Acidithiobacillus sp. CV18-3]MBU2756395.1 GNAT family N-acetyltransferase [Acidithiobacillus sp. BN09-2]MBU2776182.1 GNAT family N-acetyltransferase [Acidithiobacillus sp. CV18-2]MBU2795795.1 GNAT family N-acetyltransferase [Acidithiobacillus sp. VAN18-2]MBU2798310.1 GNAT family N-acetyltransferase [Acidithiobacillus sp. VAN18-4]